MLRVMHITDCNVHYSLDTVLVCITDFYLPHQVRKVNWFIKWTSPSEDAKPVCNTIHNTRQYTIQDKTTRQDYKTRQYKVNIITKYIVHSIYHADQQI